MKTSPYRLTWALLALTAIAFVVALPGALRQNLARGEIYLFSSHFFTDIPARLTGPGRFRFVLQPIVAVLLGIRGGRADALAGRPPFLLAFFNGSGNRRELLRSSVRAIANIVLVAILLDLVSQWLILKVAYPGAALVVGPILISAPYALARALSNRIAHAGKLS